MSAKRVSEHRVALEEIAHHLSVTRVTVLNWTQKKRDLPAHKLIRLCRSKLSEVDSWVRKGGAGDERLRGQRVPPGKRGR